MLTTHRRVAIVPRVGVAATAALEWWNVMLRHAWAYGAAMPTVAGIGLAPFMQWVLLPPLILWLARRHITMDGQVRVARRGGPDPGTPGDVPTSARVMPDCLRTRYANTLLIDADDDPRVSAAALVILQPIAPVR